METNKFKTGHMSYKTRFEKNKFYKSLKEP